MPSLHDALAGTYQINGVNETSNDAAYNSTLLIEPPSGDKWSVMSDLTSYKMHGTAQLQGAVLTVNYTYDAPSGPIPGQATYQVVQNGTTVRLTNGHWSMGTYHGHEVGQKVTAPDSR